MCESVHLLVDAWVITLLLIKLYLIKFIYYSSIYDVHIHYEISTVKASNIGQPLV